MAKTNPHGFAVIGTDVVLIQVIRWLKNDRNAKVRIPDGPERALPVSQIFSLRDVVEAFAAQLLRLAN